MESPIDPFAVTAGVEEAGQEVVEEGEVMEEEVVEDLPVKGQEEGGDGEVGSCTPLPSVSVLDST